MGGTGSGDAGLRRIVSLSAGNLRSESAGTIDFVFIYLAAFVQRATIDCVGIDRFGRVCILFLAAVGTSIHGTRLEFANPLAGQFAIALAGFRSDFSSDRDRGAGGGASISQDHEHRVDVQAAVGWRSDNNWVDHCCGIDSLQCGARVQLSGGCVHFIAQFFSGTRLGHADRGLRLLGLLQRLLSGR